MVNIASNFLSRSVPNPVLSLLVQYIGEYQANLTDI